MKPAFSSEEELSFSSLQKEMPGNQLADNDLQLKKYHFFFKYKYYVFTKIESRTTCESPLKINANQEIISTNYFESKSVVPILERKLYT